MKSLQKPFSRRLFLKSTGSVLATGFISCAGTHQVKDHQDTSMITSHRKLGRTEFPVSIVSMGCSRNRQPDVFRYAYDKGINYFDTAETYVSGNSQQHLGDALAFMDRKKVFITTKLHISTDENAESIKSRFDKCLEKLRTDYIDALYMHSVKDTNLLNQPAFHRVTEQLRAEGRLRFIGISSHGPRRNDGDSMEKVLCAAAEDGRFDLMLLVYNFMQKESGEKIIKTCQENNVGTTAMKIQPGVFKVESYDPQNPTKSQKEYLERQLSRGVLAEEAKRRLAARHKDQLETMAETQPFIQKYGIKNEAQLRESSILWVLNNKNLHTACISINSFDLVEQLINISGKQFSSQHFEYLKYFGLMYNHEYCRHGCTACTDQCHQGVPVSTIMRYSYYFREQGREKEAMQKYNHLGIPNGLACTDCSAPCVQQCPYHVNIPAQLGAAHSLLTWA